MTPVFFVNFKQEREIYIIIRIPCFDTKIRVKVHLMYLLFILMMFQQFECSSFVVNSMSLNLRGLETGLWSPYFKNFIYEPSKASRDLTKLNY